jgi:hypothetical protein
MYLLCLPILRFIAYLFYFEFKRVHDFNEVTYHFLQVLHTSAEINCRKVEQPSLPESVHLKLLMIEKEWIIYLLANATVRYVFSY